MLFTMMNRLLLFSIISYVYSSVYRHPQTSSFDFVDNRIPEMGLFISIKHKDKEQIASWFFLTLECLQKEEFKFFIDKYNVKFSIIE